MGISNTQYGILQSCVSIVNTVLPILGGIFIDRFGTSTGSLIATSFITVGSTCVALSTHLNSLPVMFFGRLLFGYVCVLSFLLLLRVSQCVRIG